jgi:hypothetical protein
VNVHFILYGKDKIGTVWKKLGGLVTLFLMPTQPPNTMGTGRSFPGVKRGRGLTLTTHPHLVLRLKMNMGYASSPSYGLHSGIGTALLYFYPGCMTV